MTLLYWIIFGLITGTLADFLSPSVNGGIIGSLFLGIIGAVVGGYIGEKFLGIAGVTGFNARSFIVSVLGALLVLTLSRMLFKGSL